MSESGLGFTIIQLNLLFVESIFAMIHCCFNCSQNIQLVYFSNPVWKRSKYLNKNFYCFHIEISLISSQVYVETLFNHDSLFFPFHIIVSYITNIQLGLNFLYTKLLAFIFTRFNIRKLLSNKPRPIIQVSLFSSRLNKILFIA